MKYKPVRGTRFFFATSPLPCPYLPGRVERRIVTELVGRDAVQLHDALSLAGYRRSHGIAYAPACPDCNACTAVRILAQDFIRSRNHKRLWKTNKDLTAAYRAPKATEEQFDLFCGYLNARHADGDMSRMDFLDYRTLVEDTPVDTVVAEFRDPAKRLVAACLVDRVRAGLSAVYSFFDPAQPRRSLGSYMILWLIEQCVERGLDHVYLGYWVAGCDKMSYKSRFRPLEAYRPDGWYVLPSGANGTS